MSQKRKRTTKEEEESKAEDAGAKGKTLTKASDEATRFLERKGGVPTTRTRSGGKKPEPAKKTQPAKKAAAPKKKPGPKKKSKPDDKEEKKEEKGEDEEEKEENGKKAKLTKQGTMLDTKKAGETFLEKQGGSPVGKTRAQDKKARESPAKKSRGRPAKGK